MRVIPAFAAWFLCACAPRGPAVERELVGLTRALLDAIAAGDRAAWDRHLAPRALFVDRDGKVHGRAHLVAEIAPLPPGFRVSFRMEDVHVLREGEAAVVTYLVREHERIFDQAIETAYRSTYHWVRRDGRWRLVVFQYLEIPADPPAARLAPAALEGLVGTYVLGPGAVYEVSREGGRLFGRRRGRPAREELVPIDAARFFVPGRDGERVFLRGPDGRATGFLHRRNWKDVRWRRAE